MIGQTELRNRIDSMIKDHTFPRFSIFVGPSGSGKKTLATEVKEMFNTNHICDYCVYSYMTPDVKIDTIRTIISQAYKTTDTAIYIIPDADSMSVNAKNAILKLTEEPPNNAYIIMTLADSNNTLETIKSRATIFYMQNYSKSDLGAYFYEKYHHNHSKSEEDIITSICRTPGDIDILVKSGIKEFYDFVELVAGNITDVSLANALKIPDRLALKENSEGYDLRLFWLAFINICFDRADSSTHSEYITWCGITSRYLQKLRTKGINKQMLVDCWLLDIRGM